MQFALPSSLHFLSFASIVTAYPQSLPPSSNSTDHGNPNLHCRAATFSDIAVFYLANYLAHCATVKLMPGENAVSSFSSMALALFFPTSGIIRAVSAIIRHARITRKDELRAAARAGALCMVVRSRHWLPQDGDVIRDYRTTETQKGVDKWKYEYSTNTKADQLEDWANPRGNDIALANLPTSGPDENSSLDRPPIPQLLDAATPGSSAPISVYQPRWMAELLPVVGSQRIYPRHRKVHRQYCSPTRLSIGIRSQRRRYCVLCTIRSTPRITIQTLWQNDRNLQFIQLSESGRCDCADGLRSDHTLPVTRQSNSNLRLCSLRIDRHSIYRHEYSQSNSSTRDR